MSDRTHRLESGREVGLSALGDPASRRLVLLCHPTGGAGGFDPNPLVTDPWSLHLLSLDRPGYAVSTRLGDDEAPSVEARADDAAEYLDHSEKAAAETQRVDFGAVGVIGWGSGGAIALSLAARHPELVDKVAIVGTASPRRRGPRVHDLPTVEFTRSHHRTVDEVAEDVPDFGGDFRSVLGIDPADPALASGDELERIGLANRLERMVQDARLQGETGIATDVIALRSRTWAGDLGAVDAKVLIVQGTEDPVTDRGDAEWFEKRLADARILDVIGGGRLSIVSAWRDILEHVAPEHGGIGEAKNEHRERTR